MHALNVIFWILFASVVAFIGWTFLQLFVEGFASGRPKRSSKRPGRHATGGSLAGDGAAAMISSDLGTSTTSGDLAAGDSGSGDSGGGEFSGGGGESGGGGSSGGW